MLFGALQRTTHLTRWFLLLWKHLDPITSHSDAAPAPRIVPCVPETVTEDGSPLARGSDNLVCAMVGLPARGKTYIARKLSQQLVREALLRGGSA